MQISKVPLMFCACVLVAALNAHAQDNAAQAAARAALAAKLFDMDAGNPSPTNAPAPATAPMPMVAPKPSIADAPPAQTIPSNEPVMYPVGATNAIPETAAQKKAELKAKKAAAKQAAAVKAQEDAAAKAQADADAKAKKLADKEAAKNHDAEVAAAEKQAKLNTDAAMKPPQPAPPMAMPDMVAPAAPISATKQQQLADLLSKYQSDQITPDEYQKQRADIMAQP